MHVLIELALWLGTIALLMQVDAAPPMLVHASGNMGTLGLRGPAARLLSRSMWLAGALAAVRRMRLGAVTRRE